MNRISTDDPIYYSMFKSHMQYFMSKTDTWRLNVVQTRLASLQEPYKGVILQSSTGEELRPFREAGRTLLPSVLDRALSNNDCHIRFRVK